MTVSAYFALSCVLKTFPNIIIVFGVLGKCFDFLGKRKYQKNIIKSE